jgi:hypothetical protein
MESVFKFLELWLMVAGLTMVLLGFAWHRWYRDLPRVKEPKSRSLTLLLGLVAGSVNALLSHGWLWYFWSHSVGSEDSILCAKIGTCLCVFAFLMAISERGGARLRLAEAAVLGVLGWVCVFAIVLFLNMW